LLRNLLSFITEVAPRLNWRGVEVLKNPCDLWMAIELIQQLRPVALIETGTHFGGSASFFADMVRIFDLKCKIITIDCNPKWSFSPETQGILSFVGYSTNPDIFQRVRSSVEEISSKTPGHVLVFLDSDHSAANVLAELRLYSKLVTLGSYIVVEDTILNGHPCFKSHGPGPWEGADAFLKEDPNFEADLNCQRFLLTDNPNGWLKRVSL
jgi:cephalosporin hydroxylase